VTKKEYSYTAREVAEMLGVSAGTMRYRFRKLVDLGLAKVTAIDPTYKETKTYGTEYEIKFLWDNHLKLAEKNRETPAPTPSPINYNNPFNLRDAVDQRRLSWTEAVYGEA
jgi:DNA-binding Lrp family transcriptional regulator